MKSNGDTIDVKTDAAMLRGKASLELAITGHKRDFDVVTGEWATS